MAADHARIIPGFTIALLMYTLATTQKIFGGDVSQVPGNTHSKRALFRLRQRIVEGEIPGGTRLYEVALAEKLQISRTPVREAMSRLAEEGLLDRANGGGFLVRSFSYADVVDAIELRGVLEGTVIAFREIVSWKFVKPVFIGDTIHVEMEIIETKAMRRLGGGKVELNFDVQNQNGETTMKGIWSVLVMSKPE